MGSCISKEKPPAANYPFISRSPAVNYSVIFVKTPSENNNNYYYHDPVVNQMPKDISCVALGTPITKRNASYAYVIGKPIAKDSPKPSPSNPLLSRGNEGNLR